MTDLPVGFSHDEYCVHVADAVARFVTVARGVDPTTPIPTCPGWTLAKLTRHTGTIHRWATRLVADLSPERIDRRTLDLALPENDRWLPGWLEAGGEALVRVLADADPDAPMWAWGPDQHVRFWSRRMLHETTIHRIDADRQPLFAAIDPLVAADGIDELFTNLRPSDALTAFVAQRDGQGSLGFVATDRALAPAARWRVELDPSGYTIDRVDEAAAAAADVVLSGPPDQLLLAIYNRVRVPSPGLALHGDPALLQAWLDHSALT